MRERRGDPPESAQALLVTLGRLVDQALERIRLQQARVELAVAMQRHMLPPALPELPGLRIAARYAPAGDGLDVGGDWYDAFVMLDGSLGLAIGDVQGHDMEAVAFMGQVRTSLRALAQATSDPRQVLGRANDLLISMGYGLFATCCFLRFDPVTRDLHVSRAGHVPMVWATAGGGYGVALDRGGPPLGILVGERYPVTHRRLMEPGVLVLLTDGVVEGPSYPMEAGLAEVAKLVRTGFDADPDVLASAVIKVADLTGHRDDAAVLVVRYDGPAPSSGPSGRP
ncbi:PP2C family protein-serine/threonine phosphatase [Streptomyces wuyuanensis]|uniref:Serine phosphatase RsbU, regulator of sigma subunit n=1 Tax=Streptomyces wuyuanensis TaxID=1196353 RepID=A0A1G9QVP4_9ACTN|nr:PP2C family protein-serine/threonine phosphatase [Streptomyces wuyuanensis]SDM15064.1 Serine phosphatase RsbU, regulator of sigma subunit [Streptomyces wuyuanensis]